MRRKRGDGWWNGNYAYIRRRRPEAGYEPAEVITETKLTDEELLEHTFNQYARVCAICDSLYRNWALPPAALLKRNPEPVALINAIEKSIIYVSTLAERAELFSNPVRVKPSPLNKKPRKSPDVKRVRLRLGNPTHKFGIAGRIQRRVSFCAKLANVASPTADLGQVLHHFAVTAAAEVIERGFYRFPDGSILYPD